MKSNLSPVQIGKQTLPHLPLGFGCSFYGINDWYGQQGKDILAAMATAIEDGITHFDTAEGYGGGESEKLIARFLETDPNLRETLFIASKANLNELTQQAILDSIDASRSRLQTDIIDLYYIHWPRTGKDLRPVMEGLETARQQGIIRAVGVSNFSIGQMEQVSEVGTIDAHQLGYNLLWRFPEKDIIPYCAENKIVVIVYSALAHGILSGKYNQQLQFSPDDQRWKILHFREDVWSKLYDSTQKFKAVAEQSGYSLVHLALRWLLHQAGVTEVLVSAKNPEQALSNGTTLNIEIPLSILDELTNISNEAMQHIPDEGNPFGYHP